MRPGIEAPHAPPLLCSFDPALPAFAGPGLAPNGAGEPAPAAGTMPRHSAAVAASLLPGLLGAFSTTLL